jgi:hypothetical protein
LGIEGILANTVAYRAGKNCKLLVGAAFEHISRILEVSILLCLGYCSCFGASLTLRGTVKSDAQQPLDVVKLKVSDPIFERQIELSPKGSFEVTMDATHLTHIYCEISAPGFETERLTIPLNSDSASIGIVRLKPYVLLGPISITMAADSASAYIDSWLTTLSPRPLTFESITVAASETNAGPCFDAAPQLLLRFARTALLTHKTPSQSDISILLNVESKDDQNHADALKVEGTLNEDACGGSLVRLNAPYSFTLTDRDAGKPRKFRVAVPLSIAVKTERTIHPDWKHATVSLRLQNGEMISATSK